MENKHNVRLNMNGKGVIPYVDDERIPFCRSVDEKGNGIKFSIAEHVEDYLASDVPCDLSEYVRFSCIVLKNELMKPSDLYTGFLASIKSAIEEAPNYTSNKELSERILNRIIGDD